MLKSFVGFVDVCYISAFVRTVRYRDLLTGVLICKVVSKNQM